MPDWGRAYQRIGPKSLLRLRTGSRGERRTSDEIALDRVSILDQWWQVKKAIGFRCVKPDMVSLSTALPLILTTTDAEAFSTVGPYPGRSGHPNERSLYESIPDCDLSVVRQSIMGGLGPGRERALFVGPSATTIGSRSFDCDAAPPPQTTTPAGSRMKSRFSLRTRAVPRPDARFSPSAVC